ncbi:enoyl-CoA hydratase/isomerase family protein [Candidatus Poriferisodalis sp.]|uniref:enoyl-CoA hydratase/isomerase family protein n=1 Tax=Candidatus Poriferisodalis sp. TaxID=3101277 RepID=UPI003B02871E
MNRLPEAEPTFEAAFDDFGRYGDVSVQLSGDHVAVVEIGRPPHNFFDLELIDSLAAAFGDLDAEDRCRASVLCSEGKNFCAGAQFGSDGERGGTVAAADGSGGRRHLYDAAFELFSQRKPVVAAIQGAAVGGGLGVACFPDFRIAAPEARFSANFARLGFHHGFGLTVTLPRLVGHQRALDLLYSGRRVKGDEAVEIGLADELVPLAELRRAAYGFAHQIAVSAPLAVESIRHTMRGHLADAVKAATDHEKAEQDRLRSTDDWREGVSAVNERRTPNFTRS